VYFVLLAAAVAILAGVVAVAMGSGGELAISRRDLPVIPPRIRTASDVARLRLPLGLFGYQAESADQVLDILAGRLAEQDAEIARLRQNVQGLGAQRASGASGAVPLDQAGPAVAAPPDAESPDAESPDGELPDGELPDAESPYAQSPDADSAGTGSPLSARGPAGGQPSAPN
jgi:hypothetical protein